MISGTAYGLHGAFFVKEASRHFCRPLSFHSFVRPAPQAFFRPDRIFKSPSRAAAVKVGPMTVIAMSRKIDRMSVLQDLATSRIKIAEAATLMGLGRRQVFRLAKAYAQRGPAALVSRKRGRPSNRAYPADLRDRPLASSGSVTRTLARPWQRRSLRSFMTFTPGPVE